MKENNLPKSYSHTSWNRAWTGKYLDLPCSFPWTAVEEWVEIALTKESRASATLLGKFLGNINIARLQLPQL